MPLLGRAIRSRRWRRQHVPVTPAPPGRSPEAIETPPRANMVSQRAAGVGARFSFILTGSTSGAIWGNLVYTDDSNLAAAAVHAGVLTAGQTGVVVVELAEPPSTAYGAVRRNGVSSRYWSNSWQWAYKFVAGVSAPVREQYILDAFAANDTTFTQPITRVNEGAAFYFVLRTTNVAPGNVAYSLSGFEDGDVKDAFGNNIARSGNLTVAYTANGDSVNGRATLYVQIPANASYGDNNVITLTLANGLATKTVTVRDTSPTYRLTTNARSVNEGATITVSLVTTNVASGTNVPYTITSPQGLDIFRGVPYALSTPHPMTGNFVVGANGSATASFEIKNDNLSEGTETFSLRLNNGLATVSVAIYDTSRSPPPPPRPPLRPAITATMRLIGTQAYGTATTQPLAANRPSAGGWGQSPPQLVGQYSYGALGRILTVEINIKNAPLFSSFTPTIYYSNDLRSWTAIPRQRLAYTTTSIIWWRYRRVARVVKTIVCDSIGANTSASATYRVIDTGFSTWSPRPATYFSTRPRSRFEEKWSFWPFWPQDNRIRIRNVVRYYKLVLPAQANSLEFIWRMV